MKVPLRGRSVGDRFTSGKSVRVRGQDARGRAAIADERG
jgi:hypothetical protein